MKSNPMEIQEFIDHIAVQFEEIDASSFNTNTAFKENDEYSSLTGMSIIAMVDEKYNVTLTGNDLRASETIEDLFNLIKLKRGI